MRFSLSMCGRTVRRLNPAVFLTQAQAKLKPKHSRCDELQAKYPQFPGIKSEAEALVYQHYIEPLGLSWVGTYEAASYVIVDGPDGAMYTPDFDFIDHDGIHTVVEVKGHIEGLPAQRSEREALIKYKILRSQHPDWRFMWLVVKKGVIKEQHTGHKTRKNS